MWKVVGWGVSKRCELVVVKSICVRMQPVIVPMGNRGDLDKARSDKQSGWLRYRNVFVAKVRGQNTSYCE